jgi:hypothetical protein
MEKANALSMGLKSRSIFAAEYFTEKTRAV